MKTDATVADGLTDRQGDICFLASLSWGSVLGKEWWGGAWYWVHQYIISPILQMRRLNLEIT